MILLKFTWKEYLKSKKQRPQKLDHLCLTEFATSCHKTKPRSDINEDEDPSDDVMNTNKEKSSRS